MGIRKKIHRSEIDLMLSNVEFTKGCHAANVTYNSILTKEGAVIICSFFVLILNLI
jgi:hypothetical protein